MTNKVPIFCCSHTVRGTCTFAYYDGAAKTKTAAEGVYWTDPIYGVTDQVAVDLPGYVSALIADATFVVPYAYRDVSLYAPGLYDNMQAMLFYSDTGATKKWTSSSASMTAEGRRLVHRLGLSTVVDSPTDSFLGGVMPGIWSPSSRGISSRRLERRGFGNSTVQHGYGGSVAAFKNIEPLPSMDITIEGLTGKFTFDRGEVPYPSSEADDYTFWNVSLERNLWEPLQRGEMVRYYEDVSAARTYITSAITAAAYVVPVKSATGLAAGDMLWVDGEPMRIVTGGVSGTNITVDRQFPVAHPIYAPVSNAFVGTYVLEPQGDTGLSSYAPRSRGYNVDRYDVTLPLRRAVWQG